VWEPRSVLKFRRHFRIGQAVQPVGGGLGEARQERAAAGRGHSPQFGFPHDFRAIAVGDDKARVQGHQVGGRPLRDGEIEPVAAGGIVTPLAVGAKVRGARLDLDDQHFALAIDRRDIGAAPIIARRSFHSPSTRGGRSLPDAATWAKAHSVARRRSPIRLLALGVVGAALALLALFIGLVALYAVARPVSTLMLARTIEGKSYQRVYAPLRTIAPTALATVIASEDASFCDNDGVDWGALREVLSGAGNHGPSRGASTITMQTAKNLFLWPGRSVIRKGIEIPMALVLGKAWSKARTLEIYLNIAEWGDGLYGIEAAAQRYFHKSASRLNPADAALLVTALPNPILRNPARPSPLQRRLAASLEAKARENSDLLKCLPR
jgi:monofunctional glycosyltransferase